MRFLNIDLDVIGSPGSEVCLRECGLLRIHEEPGLSSYELDGSAPATLEDGLGAICSALEGVCPSVLSEIRASARLVADAGFQFDKQDKSGTGKSPMWRLSLSHDTLERLAGCGIGLCVSLYE